MNTSKRLTVAAGLVAALAAAACSGDLTGLNRNPNNPEDVPATTLFTSAARNAVARWLGSGYALRGTEFVVQHLAEVQYPEEDRYTRLGAADTRTYFDNAYFNELEDFQKVIGKGMAARQAGVYGPALVMRTWGFSYLTDTWGDIPYFQALAGDSVGGSIAPAYDAQKDIYTDLFRVLGQATTDMSAASAAGNLGGADPIYDGDLEAWARFSNSLRARLALRLINVDPATANAQLTAAFSAPGGLITSNAENAELHWPGDGVYNNPWADNFKTRDDHRVSKTLYDIMVPQNDPRVPVYGMPTPADPTQYAGLQNGMLHATAGAFFNTTSRPGAVFYPGATAYGTFGGSGASFPSFIMTAAEVAFIKAEAAERGLGGLTPAEAAGFYNEGIRLSLEQWGITGAAVTNYLLRPEVVYQGGVAGQQQIATQKWIALYTDGGTAWAEWRRTCMPATIKPGPNASQNTVPRRFLYSPTEFSVNKTNVDAAIARQGADAFTTRVYWDTKPDVAPTYPGATCGVR